MQISRRSTAILSSNAIPRESRNNSRKLRSALDDVQSITYNQQQNPLAVKAKEWAEDDALFSYTREMSSKHQRRRGGKQCGKLAHRKQF